MRFQGKVIEWNDDRGFGFIEPDDGGKRVFVHIKSFVLRSKRPNVNDAVIYILKTDERGRLQARNVSFYMKSVQLNNYLLKNILFLLLVVLFFSFLGGATFYRELPFMVLCYYVLISVVTFFAYSFDKSAAEEGDWRLSEDILHSLSILGGWAGALTAQVLIRHKSKKISFKIVFWVTVAFNSILLCLMFSENGSSFLTNTLGLI